MLIREITIEDATEFTHLIAEVEEQSTYMLMEPGKRKMSAEQQREKLKQLQQQSNSTILVAEMDNKLVGYVIAIGGSTRRTEHTAYLVVGILKAYRGKGIGSALFTNMTEWAEKNKLLRLELTVVTENKAGIALYKKSGFAIEGTKRMSLIINGEGYDEYYMAKLL
ncbi:GNAT family N-acetyltransferase [Virgibacillus sp. SK37]|uniref:GNAT family N-acetyltransferase n=1 Tax=Virgibacillus sp. SK37 TaxID=403957 RepID=UPI0004D1A2F7|nr:GNAT family protein [Virgibacillus sp. SK37]AIF42962.1 GCN5 family N-acetyltransferase [Virgibacillus sp. SK37]